MEAEQNERRESQDLTTNNENNQGNNNNQNNQGRNNGQNRNKNGNNGKNGNQKQNEKQKQEEERKAKEQEEKDREMQLKEMKEKQKKESRKVREGQMCLLTNKLVRSKKDYMLCSTKQYELDKDKYSKKETAVCCSSCPPRDASLMEARCPVPGKKIKPNKDRMRCFTANMICQKLYMPGRDFECENKLKILVNICQGCKPTLKADRINVNCLPQEISKCFPMEAECLKRRLEEGILLTIIYKNKEIGHGCYVLPESCISRITNVFEEITHTANVELTCRGCTVGMCTVHLAMQMRCQNLKLVTELTDDCSEMERLEGGMDVCVDSMTSPSTSDPCVGFLDNDPEFCSESDECLDMYGMEDNIQPANLVDMAGPYSLYNQPNGNDECITINADKEHSAQFSPSRQSPYGDGCVNRLGQKFSVPQLKQTCINTSRLCHVCKEDVSWLPKIAACPYCGYRPVPEFIEKPYDEDATADDLLHYCQEQLNGEDLSSNSGDGHSPSDGNGSSEAFENILHNYEKLKKSIKKTESKNQIKDANKINAAQNQNVDSTPKNLGAVFGELRELFKSNANDTNAKIKEICEEANKLSKCIKAKQIKASKMGDKQKITVDKKTIVHKKKKEKKPRKKITYKSKLYEMPSRLFHTKKKNNENNFDGPHVPPHMGWLWTSHPLAKKTGWRPGAINRTTREVMGYFLKDFPTDTIPVSKYMSFYNQKPPPPKPIKLKPEDLVQKPTLYIEKKNDEYIITLHPLKDANTLSRSADPYVNMKPVQFRIIKNPLLKEVRDLKRCLKNMGFAKCTCHRPVIACYCRSFVDKKLLIDQLHKECETRDMDTCENALVLSDTSDSEAEFEFGVTPPAGLIHPERQKTTHNINASTQYDENDWVMPTMFPHPPDFLTQYGGCVMGERKKTFPWIFSKGNVHAKPKEPILRNKPKKKVSKNKSIARQVGGCDNENVIRSHVPVVHRSDSDYPLSEARMRRLDQAAYPPTNPLRRQKQRHVRFASLKSVN